MCVNDTISNALINFFSANSFVPRNWVCRCCFQVSSRLELWGDELQRTEPPRDPQQAEQALAAHNESVARMQHATFQVSIPRKPLNVCIYV